MVGAPQFSDDILIKKEDVLKKLCIGKHKKIIVLATSNYSEISTRIKLVEIFSRALKVLSKDNWHGIIKMHPRDELKYIELIQTLNICRFVIRSIKQGS